MNEERREQLSVDGAAVTVPCRHHAIVTMELVVEGKLTKQIARQLQISQKTVEVHRSNITRKMQVESVAQLVNIVARSLPPTED